jgi:hypothetical protein
MRRRTSIAILCAVLTPALLIAGAYAYYFGVVKNRGLSDDPGSWGEFGDYLGGTLNPTYALLAFLGVILTVYLQSQQLKLAKTQGVIEEVQRLVAGVSERIDHLFHQPPSVKPVGTVFEAQTFTVWSLLAATATSVLRNDPNMETVKRWGLRSIDLELRAIIIELQQLAWALEKYAQAGGSGIVIEFYRKRHETSVAWIHILGLAESSNRMSQYFKPEDLIVHLRPE